MLTLQRALSQLVAFIVWSSKLLVAVVAEEKKRSMEERDLLLKNLKEQEILDKQAMEDKLKVHDEA